MSKIKIVGHASGTGVLTIAAPNTNTDRTITIPDVTGTLLDSGSDLPAANLTGTIASARIADDAITTAKLANSINTEIAANTAKVTNSTSASDLTSGTLPDARFPSTLPAISGAALTDIDAVTVSTSAPGSPSAGDLWFNSGASTVSDIPPNFLAVYDSTAWVQCSNKINITGGTITTYSGYKVHTFLSTGTLTIEGGSVTVDYLLVAGGGGGYNNGWGGGGGAGGMRAVTSQTLTEGSYTVSVGAGGAHSSNGTNTTFNSITVTGGGAGGPKDTAGSAGGSGGGGGGDQATAGGGSTAYGNNGGAGKDLAPEGGAGGGGAGAVGHDGISDGTAAGGVGAVNNYRTGSNVYYAGGGGGSLGRPDLSGDYTTAVGGNGGGGAGGQRNGLGITGVNGVAGTANTGGGGGGNGTSNSGGSGIVIVRYAV